MQASINIKLHLASAAKKAAAVMRGIMGVHAIECAAI